MELPPEDVPGLQKRIIRACRQAGRPVVVATQMLESMIQAPTPTRAEASDVATAVYDGADAVMLSAESAAGSFPVEAVTIMSRIIGRVEQDSYYRGLVTAEVTIPRATDLDTISAAVGKITSILSLGAIVAYTTSGSTTLPIARERPEAPILSLSLNPRVARQLAPVWGIHSVQAEDQVDIESLVSAATSTSLREGFAEAGSPVLIIAGMPFGTPGATNLLRIARA